MFSINENRTNKTISQSMMNHFVGSVDLTGAELEFAGCCLNITSGRLGHFDSKTSQVKGHLSIVSRLKPSLLSSLIRIRWRDQEFEVMMISLKETTVENELKLKFVARLVQTETAVEV